MISPRFTKFSTWKRPNSVVSKVLKFDPSHHIVYGAGPQPGMLGMTSWESLSHAPLTLLVWRLGWRQDELQISTQFPPNCVIKLWWFWRMRKVWTRSPRKTKLGQMSSTNYRSQDGTVTLRERDSMVLKPSDFCRRKIFCNSKGRLTDILEFHWNCWISTNYI